MLSKLKIVYKL